MVGNKINSTMIILLGMLFLSTISTIPSIKGQENEQEIYFEVTLLVPTNNPDRLIWAEMIAEELPKIGIGVNIDKSDFLGVEIRVWEHPERPVPIYEDNGYDMVFVGIAYDDFMFERSGSSYSSYNDPAEIDNSYGYESEEYINLQEQLFSEFNETNRVEIIQKFQNLIYNDLPAITIWNQQTQAIVRNDWNLSKEEIFGISSNSMLSGWGEMSYDNKDTISMIQPLDSPGVVVTPFYENTDAEHQWWKYFPNMIFQSLYERDPFDNNSWTPLIADGFPTMSSDFKKATVKIRNDVKFSDNENLTAYDVVESYRTYLTPNPFVFSNTYDDLTRYFASNASIVLIDDYTIEFNFNEPFIYYMDLLSHKILPIHLYGNHSNQVIQENPNSYILAQIAENGTSPLMVGSGPYQVSEFDYNGTVNLQANVNYWKGDVQTKFINTTSFISLNDSIAKIQSGEMDLLFPGQYDVNYLKTISDIRIITVDSFFEQELGINMQHPIFGSGIETPLGIANPEDPLIAQNAARYIRQAISHIIPRDRIVDEVMNGNVRSGVISMPNTIIGYDKTMLPYTYDLSKAKLLMEQAGYISEVESTTNSNTTTSESGSDGSFIEFNSTTIALTSGIFVIAIIYMFTKSKKAS